MLFDHLDDSIKTEREKHQNYFRRQNKILAVVLDYFITLFATTRYCNYTSHKWNNLEALTF